LAPRQRLLFVRRGGFRRGACAPQERRMIAHVFFVMSSEAETSLNSVSLRNS
jgi:hypothetical protein